MHDLRTVVEKRDEVVASLCKRGATHLTAVVDEIVAWDQKRRSCIQSVEGLKSKRNQASQEIARLKKSGQDISTILAEMQTVAESIRTQDEQLKIFESQLNRLMFELPNMIQSEVPEGVDASRNQVIREWGVPRKFAFDPKTHDELGERLGVLDFQRAGMVTGARFVFLKGWAARLERALIQFMMDTHSSRDYVEVIPPFIVNRQALVGTGQLPKFEGDVFKIEGTDYFLIPTAEVPVTNYHRDEILPSAGLPLRYVAFSPCFRSEAGNYGKDTKGMKRQHQFQKVELVVVSHPDKSAEEHERLTGDAERILQLLELPYRVVALCAGDTGFSSSKTYDLEVWAPGMNQFMEISSCSNFLEFQARRANIRFRDETGKVRHVHTLNGSGLAIGRTVIAIMENYQQENGTIDIPEILKPYFD